MPGSVMERLGQVRDPRRREGERYRLPGLIGMLILAAINGEASLRGMWLWGRSHWEQIAEPLGLAGTKGAPAYGTVWGLMAGVDSEELSQALSGEAQEGEDGYTIDGKKMRGSKRATESALQVVTLAGAKYGEILGQKEVQGAKICLCFHRPNCRTICANLGRLKIGSSTSGMSVLMKTGCTVVRSAFLFPSSATFRSISFLIWASGSFLMPAVPFPLTPISASLTSSVHLH